MSARTWITIGQDDEGNLVIVDAEGKQVAKMARTLPAGNDAPANKWSEVLVSDVARLARFAMAVIVKQDHEISKF